MEPTPPPPSPPSFRIIPNTLLLFHCYTIYTFMAERTMFTSSAGFMYSVVLWPFIKESKYMDHTVFNRRYLFCTAFLCDFSFCCTFPFLACLLAFKKKKIYIYFNLMTPLSLYSAGWQASRHRGSASGGEKHITLSFVLLARGTLVNCRVDRFSL